MYRIEDNGSGMKRMRDYHRHDLSDQAWEHPEENLPGRGGQWGGIAQDNRRFINGVFWILQTGAPWQDLPPDYGDWKNTRRRFCRWRDKGVWEKPPETLSEDRALEKISEARYQTMMPGYGQERAALLEAQKALDKTKPTEIIA